MFYRNPIDPVFALEFLFFPHTQPYLCNLKNSRNDVTVPHTFFINAVGVVLPVYMPCQRGRSLCMINLLFDLSQTDARIENTS